MRRRVIILILILITVSLTFIWAEYQKTQTVKLDAVEVREYQGQKLSSVNDFRENSIKGPQFINTSNYHLEVTGLVENPRNYTYQDLINRQNYEKVVTLHCVEGWDVTILWQGICVSSSNTKKPRSKPDTWPQAIFLRFPGAPLCT